MGRLPLAPGAALDPEDGPPWRAAVDLAAAHRTTRYQPPVDLRTGAVVGTEALVRWEHPVRGRLGPGALLGLAVERRLLADIDAWMLRTACGQTAQWGRVLSRPVAVRVDSSGQSLADARLPSRVADALRGSQLPPQLLTLETTEDAVMHDAARTVHLLADLRRLGVSLAVDDSGTGCPARRPASSSSRCRP